MNIAGIIAEYNPFHNGHKYHIEEVRKITGADYVVAVMSGNFTQRGLPALTDKYLRTSMALQNGVDLVLELPCLYACSSAESFAFGGVSLLHALGAVTHLGFGCETASLSVLDQVARILAQEPASYQEALKLRLKEGLSFPQARALALSDCQALSVDETACLSSPNNILAVEYLKALHRLSSSILPVPVLRKGSGYLEKELQGSFSSAFAIRTALQETKDLSRLSVSVPENVLTLLSGAMEKTLPVTTDAFSSLLYYKLLLHQETGYTGYLDVTPDLSDKIKKNLHSYQNFDSFCSLLKSKDMTYTRICRCLLHILLDIPALPMLPLTQPVPYARILGFRKESAALLGILKQQASIPFLSTASEAREYLNDSGRSSFDKELLKLDLKAAAVYTGVVRQLYQAEPTGEFTAPLLIL